MTSYVPTLVAEVVPFMVNRLLFSKSAKSAGVTVIASPVYSLLSGRLTETRLNMFHDAVISSEFPSSQQ